MERVLDVVIDGRPAKLTLEAGRLRYRPEGGQTIEREFSLEEAGPEEASDEE